MGHTTNIDLNKEVPVADLKVETTPEQRAVFTKHFKKEPIQATAQLVSMSTAAAREEATKDQQTQQTQEPFDG